ncbi:MAG: hypothetical protein NT120_01465 [Candidatus Aenigmarchaeota archaeon]|nr:hypothetical protein [Candidatus Aenigmarchaeota archaeon]
MGFFGAYEYKAKNGQKWYLHAREKGKVRFYFFSKDSVDALSDIPGGYEIFLNPRTGLPMLKKKEKKEKVKK